jgi:hypothetical protein
MIENDYPVSDYYKNHVIDGRSISRKGPWWSALLLIEEPSNNVPFLSFYRWHSSSETWTTKSKFIIRKKKDAERAIEILNEFIDKI